MVPRHWVDFAGSRQGAGRSLNGLGRDDRSHYQEAAITLMLKQAEELVDQNLSSCIAVEGRWPQEANERLIGSFGEFHGQ